MTLQSLQSLQRQRQRFRFRFRLRSSDLQSDSDLDSIRNSCDVFVEDHLFFQRARGGEERGGDDGVGLFQGGRAEGCAEEVDDDREGDDDGEADDDVQAEADGDEQAEGHDDEAPEGDHDEEATTTTTTTRTTTTGARGNKTWSSGKGKLLDYHIYQRQTEMVILIYKIKSSNGLPALNMANHFSPCDMMIFYN